MNDNTLTLMSLAFLAGIVLAFASCSPAADRPVVERPAVERMR